jgi:protein MBA1
LEDIMCRTSSSRKRDADTHASRYVYTNCMVKTGWRRFDPVDRRNGTQIMTLAKAHYEQLWLNFAKYALPIHLHTPYRTNSVHSGESKAFKQFCLPPLVKKLESRITARGDLKMEWRLHGEPKARIVSHRAQPLGDEQPDTAYRQVVIRLESTQSLSRTSGKGSTSTTRSGVRSPSIRRELPWIPDSARQHILDARQRVRKLRDEGEKGAVVRRGEFPDNGKPKKVVEYLVMQKRVIRGREEDWKVWGFARESTPERLEDDAEYWRKTLDMQVSGGA